MPSHRTRIKVCGMTRTEDIEAAACCGVDAIGLVFYPQSPRAVSVEQAQGLLCAVPPFVDVVALFVDPEPSLVATVVERVQPDLLQFHGDETPGFCAQFSRPYLKALRVRSEQPLAEPVAAYQGARGILLDTYQAGVPGGTGRTFNWDLIPPQLRRSIILAGGLNPDNAEEAIFRVQPWAVDVSGGVERARGVKDAGLIGEFVARIEAADKRVLDAVT